MGGRTAGLKSAQDDASSQTDLGETSDEEASMIMKGLKSLQETLMLYLGFPYDAVAFKYPKTLWIKGPILSSSTPDLRE